MEMTVPLTDLAIRSAKPKTKPYRLLDGGGLFLFITPAGGRFWRYRYERGGREQTLSIGEYPDTKLADARSRRDHARKLIRAGGDPTVPIAAAAQVSGPLFVTVMKEWLDSQSRTWAPRHARKVGQALDKWVTPVLGGKAIETITTLDVSRVYQPLDARGAGETLRQIRERVTRIFRYAEGQGLIVKNPATIAGQGMAPQIKGRNPAITDLPELRKLLAAVDAVAARPVTRLALRLLALTAVRQGELRIATWSEFHGLEGAKPEWRIPVAHMKIPLTKRLGLPDHHLVPLSAQAVETIAVLHTLTGEGPLPFPSAVDPHRPMSENALSELLIRAGYKDRHVPHGFRASFSTIMNELHRADRLMIDYMLAHKLRDQVESAYNRGEYHDRRRELAQIWADLIMKDAPPATALLDYRRRP
jgi:integrase